MTEDELLKRIDQAAEAGWRTLDLAGNDLEELPAEIGRLTQLETLILGKKLKRHTTVGNRLTKLPPEIGQLKHLKTLQLFKNQLTALPPEIGQLTELRLLFLEGNQLTELPPEITQLQNLRSLILRDNQLSSLPPEITQLQNLRSLNLWNNQLSSLPPEIAQLQNLQTLDLDGNQLSSLPPEITQLQNLQTLYLSNNQLSSLPSEITQLQNLRRLHLGSNQLSSLPPEITQLQNLQTLYLDGNQLSSLPPEITQLQNLQTLYLSNNQLSSLPPEITQLQNLRSLNLWNNQLSSLPPEITQLQNLQTLYLSNNQLSSLPSEIFELPHLVELWLSQNHISSIPPEIRRLVNLKKLDLRGNPVPIPPEILGAKELYEEPGDLNTILDFYFQVQDPDETEPLYEAKLLVVGEGGAGKTSLAKKIENQNYKLQQDEKSTQGIDVIRWEFPHRDGQPFRVNIWDFGGQEIYHQTHQFFLTERSLYALVVDSRRENTNFYYWLNVVRLLSGDSPVLIIKNEKQDRQCQVNEPQLRKEFGNLKETLATNLADDRGLEAIKDRIQMYISRLPHVGQPLPKTWVRVRAALENYAQHRNYISREEFFELCKLSGLSDRTRMLSLSKYLHDLGVCLHFQADPLLKQIVILKPEWATAAVYQVLDTQQVKANLGRFTRTEAAAVWQNAEYAEMHDELLQLMKNFKLCYEIPGRPHTFIAPQLLKLEQLDYAWDESSNLILRYEYEFMPKGILTRFIVEMHPFIEQQQLVWQTGVVLNNGRARAEVTEDFYKNEIKIRASGAHRKELLSVIDYKFFEIHQSFERLQYHTRVPCNCNVCEGNQAPCAYNLDTLCNFLKDQQYEIQCQKSYQMVDVRRLLNDVEIERQDLNQPNSRSKPQKIADKLSGFNIQVARGNVIIQQSEQGENIMTDQSQNAEAPPPKTRAKSSWANGLFYLFVFVVVIFTLNFVAGNVSPFTLALIIFGGVLFIPIIGAFQLRQDDRLSENSFLELMKMVVEQLPLVKTFLDLFKQPAPPNP